MLTAAASREALPAGLQETSRVIPASRAAVLNRSRRAPSRAPSRTGAHTPGAATPITGAVPLLTAADQTEAATIREELQDRREEDLHTEGDRILKKWMSC